MFAKVSAPTLASVVVAGLMTISPLFAQYGVPEANPPVCVDGCSDGGSSGGGGGGNTVDFWERLRARREAAAENRRIKAHEQNQQGVAAFKRGDYSEALRLFRKAAKNNPDDAVMRQNVKNAEAEVERERKEQKRREEELKMRAEFRKQNQSMLSLMTPIVPFQAPQTPEKDRKAVPLPLKPAGLSETEWRELRRCEEEVNRLYEKRNTKGALNDADAQALFAALRQRNALWSKAVTEPHTIMERDNLRLTFPIFSRKVMSAVHLKDLDQPEEGQTAGRKPSDRDAAITNMIAEHSTDKTQEIIDSKTGELIKDTMGRKASDRFENILGITRVAMKSREGAPHGGAKAVDFIISKLPKPTSSRAEMARDGGKIYSNVVYRALGNFIDRVNQGFGFNIDKSKLMKDVDENMSNQQKAVKVWIGFGEQ